MGKEYFILGGRMIEYHTPEPTMNLGEAQAKDRLELEENIIFTGEGNRGGDFHGEIQK